MLKILLNGSEFNSGREERQPSFFGLTRRHNTSSNTPTGMLPICLSAIRRIKPTSETKLNLEEEPAGEWLHQSTLLLGTSAKDKWMGFALPLLWQKANVQPTKKAVDDSTDLSGHWVDVLKTELLLGHYHTALCVTDVSQLYLSVHVVKSPQLNSWAILSVHTASIFSLKQVWDHPSQIFFSMVRQTKLHCLPLATGQEHSRGQSSQHSWHEKFYFAKLSNSFSSRRLSLSLSPATKNKPALKKIKKKQTCPFNRDVSGQIKSQF